MNGFLKRVWGEATAFFERPRAAGWVDLVLIAGLAGLFFGALQMAQEWTGHARRVFSIDLSPHALPRYAFFSLCRGLLAYSISLAFTLVYGYWAAKDRRAERILVPLLDVLQSVPVLGFMPGFVLGLAALFPSSNLGLELAAVLMIFTGQAWNMTFSFYHSLRSVPQDFREAAGVYRFDWRRKLRCVELPSAALGLVWNSMMSMAGGWFFLMISESFVLGDKDFRLPGLGSYMSAAVEQGNIPAMLWAVAAMAVMIVLLDQLLWHPVVVWAQKFRVEESAGREAATSWFLDWLTRSRVARAAARLFKRSAAKVEDWTPPSSSEKDGRPSRWAGLVSVAAFAALVVLLGWGSLKLYQVLKVLTLGDWGKTVKLSLVTLMRVLLATALGTLWTLPAGLAIGLSPRLSRALQPVVQVVASFPAPMLFPAVVALLQKAGVGLGWGSVVLMLLGTQWYVLFNVIAGAMAVPADLREAARSYHLNRWTRFTKVYAPSVFPYLVTGWVTAAGGAWNASIVSEFVTFRGQVIATHGLGARISLAAQHADFPTLAAGVVVMSVVVVLFNRTVWKTLYERAERQFSVSK